MLRVKSRKVRCIKSEKSIRQKLTKEFKEDAIKPVPEPVTAIFTSQLDYAAPEASVDIADELMDSANYGLFRADWEEISRPGHVHKLAQSR